MSSSKYVNNKLQEKDKSDWDEAKCQGIHGIFRLIRNQLSDEDDDEEDEGEVDKFASTFAT